MMGMVQWDFRAGQLWLLHLLNGGKTMVPGVSTQSNLFLNKRYDGLSKCGFDYYCWARPLLHLTSHENNRILKSYDRS